jgi:hypothetical protein
MSRKFTKINVSPEEANRILNDVIPKMLPDPLGVWEFVSSDTIIAATLTNRMFLIHATDDGAFDVQELDPTRFAIIDDDKDK